MGRGEERGEEERVDRCEQSVARPPSVRKEGMNGSDREELGGRKDGDIIDQSVIVALRHSDCERYR